MSGRDDLVNKITSGEYTLDDLAAAMGILLKGPVDNTPKEVIKKKRGRPKKTQDSPIITEETTIPISRRHKVGWHGPNKFFGSGIENMHKSDSKIDKKLWGNNEVSQRRPIAQHISIACNVCGRTCKVPPEWLISDEEGTRYTCDRCIAKGK